MKNWLKEFTHNCIVHPLLMILPRKVGDALHDRNASWVYGKEEL